MFTNEHQDVCFKSLNNVINFTLVFKWMTFFCQHCIHWLDYGLPSRLHLSNQVHEPCIRSGGFHRNVYVIRNFSLNKISRNLYYFQKLQKSFAFCFSCIEK